MACLQPVADHAPRLGTEGIEGVGLGEALVVADCQARTPTWGAVPVSQDQLVASPPACQLVGRDLDVADLGTGVRLPPRRSRAFPPRATTILTSQSHCPGVATITALMVCIRFSAWSKATLRSVSGDVGHLRPSIPVLAKMSSPTVVLRSWKARRQAVENFTSGLPVASTSWALTW